MKKCINPCLSLPKKNCSKELEDIFVHLIPKKEASSPTEEVDDYESWLAELYDPNISTTLLLSEPANEQKVTFFFLEAALVHAMFWCNPSGLLMQLNLHQSVHIFKGLSRNASMSTMLSGLFPIPLPCPFNTI